MNKNLADRIKQLPKIILKNNSHNDPIVFVHGFNSSYLVHEIFYKNQKNHDYYSLTLPGCDLTFAYENELSVYYYADLIAEFIQMHNLKNVILMGHSMGGGIISLVVKKIPQLIKKMVYIAPMNKTSLVLKDDYFRDYFPKTPKDYLNFLKSLYYDISFAKDKQFLKDLEKNFNPHLYHNDNIKKLGASLPNLDLMNDIESGLDSIDVPTLLILGEQDGVIDRDNCLQYFKNHVKQIKTVVIPKTGHMMFKEKFSDYCAVLNIFFKQ